MNNIFSKICRLEYLFAILLIFVPCGCTNVEKTNLTSHSSEAFETTTASIKDTQQTPTLSPTATPTDVDDIRAKEITIADDNIKVLKNGLTLSEIEQYLTQSREISLAEIGIDNYEQLGADYTLNFVFEIKEAGISLFQDFESGSESSPFDFVECDSDQVSFLGVSESMNFQQIQECIAPTDIIAIDRGLPGIVSYELRYLINDVRVKFIAWDELGENSWILKIENSFYPDYDYIKIAIDQHNEYFSMSIDEMLNYLGPEASLVYTEKFRIIKMNEFSFYYDINENNDDLQSLLYPRNYEIGGVRDYYSSAKVQQILGEANEDEIEVFPLAGDPYYIITYDYMNFQISFTFDFFYQDLHSGYIYGLPEAHRIIAQ